MEMSYPAGGTQILDGVGFGMEVEAVDTADVDTVDVDGGIMRKHAPE